MSPPHMASNQGADGAAIGLSVVEIAEIFDPGVSLTITARHRRMKSPDVDRPALPSQATGSPPPPNEAEWVFVTTCYR